MLVKREMFITVWFKLNIARIIFSVKFIVTIYYDTRSMYHIVPTLVNIQYTLYIDT